MSGHLGVNKTYQKILIQSFWPGLKSDVSQHCKSCHICQMVGKPIQTISKACLHHIPVFDKPFSRIIIDCVGPLTQNKPGFQYRLTIMCASTRFPEAVPARNTKTKTTAKALEFFFTLWAFMVLYNLIKVQILCQEIFNNSCMKLALNNTSHLLVILKAM